MSSSVACPRHQVSATSILPWICSACVRPLQALIAAPGLLFLATLGLMLFHPPEFHFHSLDRVAFVVLVLVVLLRASVSGRTLRFADSATWPMSAMLGLAFCAAVSQPYEAETWSLFAAKWLVPFTLYHLAGHVLGDERTLQWFETFSVIVLVYLSLTAVCFMVGATQLVFPRYILDEGLGIHADRARGPFLQAVANGVALNLLGLLALNAYRRQRLCGIWAALVLAALPLAILATRTRAVWLSFSASILGLLFFSPSRRLRRLCLGLVIAGCLALVAVFALADRNTTLTDRLEESGPVLFRMEVYQAGWDMFLEKPLTGWSTSDMQADLSRRVSGFRQDQFYFHNTYLEIAVQYGIVGLLLYLWIMVDLFRLTRRGGNQDHHSPGTSFLDQEFRGLWPLLLGVYLLNGSFVVMNYQFVNGFLFSVAGLLAAQNRRRTEAAFDATAG